MSMDLGGLSLKCQQEAELIFMTEFYNKCASRRAPQAPLLHPPAAGGGAA